jgi:hypothetical protein
VYHPGARCSTGSPIANGVLDALASFPAARAHRELRRVSTYRRGLDIPFIPGGKEATKGADANRMLPAGQRQPSTRGVRETHHEPRETSFESAGLSHRRAAMVWLLASAHESPIEGPRHKRKVARQHSVSAKQRGADFPTICCTEEWSFARSGPFAAWDPDSVGERTACPTSQSSRGLHLDEAGARLDEAIFRQRSAAMAFSTRRNDLLAVNSGLLRPQASRTEAPMLMRQWNAQCRYAFVRSHAMREPWCSPMPDLPARRHRAPRQTSRVEVSCYSAAF